MPSNGDSYGCNYTDDQRDLLVGCDSMIIHTSMIKASMMNDYHLLTMAYPDIKEQITYDEFKMGKVMASTRAYDLVWTDGVVR